MPEPIRFRHRHRLRRKEIELIAEALAASWGVSTFAPEEAVDRAEAMGGDLLFVQNELLGFFCGAEPALTVRGLLRYRPTKQWVTVDMGAVPFVAKGADVMGPGVVAADPEIRVGALVWVRDERNLQPLAVGRALVEGRAMLGRPKGKVVESIHHVGDRLWLYEPEE